ncbi:hypothetical protein ACROYT_G020044, partial [Oculina patagonica]
TTNGGEYLMFFTHAVHLLLYKINSTVVKYRSRKILYLSPFSLHTSSTNLISQKFNDSARRHTGYVSAQALHFNELSVLKAQGSIAGLLFFLPFCHSRKIFKDHFVAACVDFGVALSNNFLSSSAFLGFRKALEVDAMSSSFSSKHV